MKIIYYLIKVFINISIIIKIIIIIKNKFILSHVKPLSSEQRRWSWGSHLHHLRPAAVRCSNAHLAAQVTLIQIKSYNAHCILWWDVRIALFLMLHEWPNLRCRVSCHPYYTHCVLWWDVRI